MRLFRAWLSPARQSINNWVMGLYSVVTDQIPLPLTAYCRSIIWYHHNILFFKNKFIPLFIAGKKYTGHPGYSMHLGDEPASTCNRGLRESAGNPPPIDHALLLFETKVA